MTTLNTKKLTRDLQAVFQDVEALLKATADNTDKTLSGTRKQAEASLSAARTSLVTLEKQMSRQVARAARTTDRYVHDNPWPVIGAAAGLAAILGLLLGRRR